MNWRKGGERRFLHQVSDDQLFGASRPFMIALVILTFAAHVWAANYPIVRRNTLTVGGQETNVFMIVALLGGLLVCVCELVWLRLKFGRFLGCLYSILLLITSGFLSILALVQLVTALNGALDSNASQKYRAQVLSKSASHYKSQVSYFLFVRDWKKTGSVVAVEVPELRFNQVKVGEKTEVETKPGALGIEWLVRVS